MGLARKLQPRALDDGWDGAPAPAAGDLQVSAGLERAEGRVALLTWDDLGKALASGHGALADAWLTLVSSSNDAHLLIVRATWLVTTAPADDALLPEVGFGHGSRPDEWVRRLQPADLDAAARVLRGPLQVPHPGVLRFGLVAPEVRQTRLLFGPLREQGRRAGERKARLCSARPVHSGPPCRRCGRPLVDAVSVARGYGPACSTAVGKRDTHPAED